MLEAAAIILAGGKSSRFQSNKAVAELAEERLIDRIVSMLREVFSALYLVTNTPELFAGLQLEMLGDLLPGHGPLGGIHAGLTASRFDRNLVVACDMPFINPSLAVFLVGEADEGCDLVVPVINGYPEPLGSVYRKSCQPVIEDCLRRGSNKVTAIYDRVRVKYIPEERLLSFGGEKNFFNVNTKEDLNRAREMINK